MIIWLLILKLHKICIKFVLPGNRTRISFYYNCFFSERLGDYESLGRFFSGQLSPDLLVCKTFLKLQWYGIMKVKVFTYGLFDALQGKIQYMQYFQSVEFIWIMEKIKIHTWESNFTKHEGNLCLSRDEGQCRFPR